MKWILSASILIFVVINAVRSKPGPPPGSGSGSNSNAVMACQQLAGGICVKKGECPNGFLATAPTTPSTQLCDAEQDCCYTFSDTVKPCHERGGECTLVSSCGNGPVDLKGQCTPGMVCCVHVGATK